MSTTPFDADYFLQNNWQQRARFLPGFIELSDTISPEELAGLALEDHIESRFVEFDGVDKWTQTEGPFSETFFQTLPDHNWTLLVQAVDLWLPAIRDVYAQFSFLPQWRFDDIMVSYATANGGVGPHFDFYDVFLIQASGHRRWQVGTTCDETTPLVTDGGMRTLAEFNVVESYETNPGDVLYIPPGIAHWGESLDSSVTYSVGFRSPTSQEVLYDLAIELESRGSTEHFRDLVAQQATDPNEIRATDIAAVQTLLRRVVDDESFIGDWLARYMTRPKYEELIELSNENRRASLSGHIYVNGELDD